MAPMTGNVHKSFPQLLGYRQAELRSSMNSLASEWVVMSPPALLTIRDLDQTYQPLSKLASLYQSSCLRFENLPV